MGSEQKENVGGGGGVWKAEVDTTAPFESVMEAVTRFGGIGYWKPHTRDPSQTTSRTGDEKVPDSAKVEDEATKTRFEELKVTEERETHEILKEIEATKTRFEELKVKLQKEEAHSSDSQSNDSDTAANVQQVYEVELSKTEILKRVEEATEEVKHCTKVIEEALSRVNTCRHKSSEFENLGPPMSIGQILSRKLVLAEENSAKSCIRWKVSLSQVLRKTSNGEKRGGHGGEKRVAAKRMKFGFCG